MRQWLILVTNDANTFMLSVAFVMVWVAMIAIFDKR